MCGIVGLFNLAGAPVDPASVRRMTRSVAHRGPDGCGVFIDGSVGLGHRRLSILDLEGGQQPLTSADGSLRITFNGEIFNHVELMHDLRLRGCRFSTRSDAEVILQLYREHGDDCVRLLNGEWAFAIWDATRRRLFLSRDRLGVRPLFYTVANDCFIFGSEIKAIFQNPEVPRSLDVEALDQVFTFWTPLPSRTLFRHVCELPPGHSLVVEDREVRLQRYWELPAPPAPGEPARDEQEAAEQLLELITDATRIRLRADVPVGAYLSGGLDSTLTAAVAQNLTADRLRTFSVAFDDPAFDESGFQTEAAKHLGSDHYSYRCAEREIAAAFPEVIWHTERPILRTAPVPLFLLSKRVRQQGYKAVLTGEGADELLGGYDIFKETKIRTFWSAFPESKIRPRLLRRLYPYLPDLQNQPDPYLRAFFRVTPDDCASPFFSHLPRWQVTSGLKRFYSADLRSQLRGYDPIEALTAAVPAAYPQWDSFSRAQYLESAHLLPGYILSSQGDRVSLAHGVEGRFPFLDHRVVEFASGLPVGLKMKGLNEKYLLKRAAKGLVPSSIIRRRKQPYRAPDVASFFAPGIRRAGYIEELLSETRLSQDGLFHPPAVARLVSKARRGRLGTKDNMSVCGILSTQLLVDRFVRSFSHASDRD